MNKLFLVAYYGKSWVHVKSDKSLARLWYKVLKESIRQHRHEKLAILIDPIYNSIAD